MARLKLLIKDQAENVYTLSDSVSVDPLQPTDDGVLLWVDTMSGKSELKFKDKDNEWKNVGGCPAYSDVWGLDNVAPAKFITADLSYNSSLSFATIPAAGTECHIIVHNRNSSDAITITILSGENYVNMTDDVLVVDIDGYVEINAISDGSKLYIRSIQ